MLDRLKGLPPVAQLVRFFEDVSGVTRKRDEERWAASLRESAARAKAQMKPHEGPIGYFIGQPGAHRIVPVKVEALRAAINHGKDAEELSPSRLRYCRRAFADNNRMMEMMHVRVNDAGDILLVEGNHRLDILHNSGEATTLVYVSDTDYPTLEGLNHASDHVLARCGVSNASVEVENGAYVYCSIDYNESGGSLIPFIYETRYKGAYYTAPACK